MVSLEAAGVPSWKKYLHGEISKYFEEKEFLKETRDKGGYKKTREKSHSQMETREYYQCDKINWMNETGRWKGIKSIGMVKKHKNRRKDGCRKKVLHKQSAAWGGTVCKGSAAALVSGGYALASGCDI